MAWSGVGGSKAQARKMTAHHSGYSSAGAPPSLQAGGCNGATTGVPDGPFSARLAQFLQPHALSTELDGSQLINTTPMESFFLSNVRATPTCVQSFITDLRSDNDQDYSSSHQAPVFRHKRVSWRQPRKRPAAYAMYTSLRFLAAVVELVV